MGRLGPLTSLALGRSPYEDIVQGEGEPDPRAPVQLYDERGRPVNPETKRINKDVIRSHNEVMLVIGVAEAENEASDAQAEMERRHDRYEKAVGSKLFYLSKVLQQVVVWGVDGLRQRIMLYKPYSYVPLAELARYQTTQQPWGSYFLVGLPAFTAGNLLRHISFFTRRLDWAWPAIIYVSRHIEMYTFLQRVGLLPSWPWLPTLSFFVPGSAASPIPIPPLPSKITAGSALQWVGLAALSALPFVGIHLCSRVARQVTMILEVEIYGLLPKPVNQLVVSPPRRRLPRDATVAPPPETTAPEALTAEPVSEEQPRNGHDIARDEPTFRALEGQPPPNDPLAVSAVRRRSTFSLRGDDFGSDDEETEVVSATLISFDVEATESTDPPPGVWSAELRPNVADSRYQTAHVPRYRENNLTALPAALAAQAIALPLTRIIMAPIEAISLRSLARLFAVRRGLSTNTMHGIGLLGSISFAGVANLLAVEVIHLFFQADMWGLMTTIARQARMSDEEWLELHGDDASGDTVD